MLNRPTFGGHIKLGTLIFVELAGVEPASKQSAKKLSTRLFFLWLSAAVRGKTPLAAAYPLNLNGTWRRQFHASALNDTPWPGHKRLKAGGIYVSAAALAALINA